MNMFNGPWPMELQLWTDGREILIRCRDDGPAEDLVLRLTTATARSMAEELYTLATELDAGRGPPGPGQRSTTPPPPGTVPGPNPRLLE